MTNGTRRLAMEYAAETLTPEVRAAAVEALRSPEIQAKLRAIKTGRPAHPRTASALRDAAKRPKSESFKLKMSKRMLQVWRHSEEHGLGPCHHWTEEQIALIGTDTDQAIAQTLGLPRYSITWKRYQLGIPSFIPAFQRWTEAEIRMLGTATDSEVARSLGKSAKAVRLKRQNLGNPRPTLAGPRTRSRCWEPTRTVQSPRL